MSVCQKCQNINFHEPTASPLRGAEHCAFAGGIGARHKSVIAFRSERPQSGPWPPRLSFGQGFVFPTSPPTRRSFFPLWEQSPPLVSCVRTVTTRQYRSPGGCPARCCLLVRRPCSCDEGKNFHRNLLRFGDTVKSPTSGICILESPLVSCVRAVTTSSGGFRAKFRA